jgi:hypothetical protein
MAEPAAKYLSLLAAFNREVVYTMAAAAAIIPVEIVIAMIERRCQGNDLDGTLQIFEENDTARRHEDPPTDVLRRDPESTASTWNTEVGYTARHT